MKVAPSNIQSTVSNLPSTTRVVLFYGPDYGLVNERALILKNNFLGNPYEESQYIQIFESQLRENINIIAENAYSISLFGENKKCIIVNEAKDFITKKLEEYIANPDSSTLLIIKAQELSPSSSLRKLCENSKEHVLAIPCYADNEASLKQTILEKLKQNSINIDTKALNLLISLLGNDRGITNMELDKIVLYASETKNITEEDVENLIANNSLTALDKFIYTLFNLETNLAYSMIKNILEENNPIVILRAISSHLQKLLFIKTLCTEQNITIDIALKEIKPPIFFNYIGSFKKQVNLWSDISLKKLLNEILNLEITLKTNSNVGELVIKDLILKRFLAK